MSKMSNLDQILDEMITAGQKMIEAANALRDIFSNTSDAAEAKALLTKFNANRLSEVKDDDYSALVAAAEELINE